MKAIGMALLMGLIGFTATAESRTEEAQEVTQINVECVVSTQASSATKAGVIYWRKGDLSPLEGTLASELAADGLVIEADWNWGEKNIVITTLATGQSERRDVHETNGQFSFKTAAANYDCRITEGE